MEAAALKRPPRWLERIVLLFIPPAAREGVGGDLCETYRSAPQYALEALRTVPFVIVSQMRRNANLPTLGLQAFLIFFCYGGFAAAQSGPLRWAQLGLPVAAVLALLLRDAYQATSRPSARRAMLEAIAVAYGALLFLQIVTLAFVVMRHMTLDLLLGIRLVFLVPLTVPLLCLFRTGLIIKGDGSQPFPARDLSMEDVVHDYSHFRQRVARRNRGEAGALGLAALVAALFLLPVLTGLYASIGLALIAVYALVAGYVLLEGAAQPLPANADFLSLRALYQRELARQQQLRRFLLWLWLAPVLIALHAELIQGGFATGQPIPIALGIVAVIVLCFFISALNREHGGWVQEKIGVLDRVREQNA